MLFSRPQDTCQPAQAQSSRRNKTTWALWVLVPSIYGTTISIDACTCIDFTLPGSANKYLFRYLSIPMSWYNGTDWGANSTTAA